MLFLLLSLDILQSSPGDLVLFILLLDYSISVLYDWSTHLTAVCDTGFNRTDPVMGTVVGHPVQLTAW